jgi:hypothetical protein
VFNDLLVVGTEIGNLVTVNFSEGTQTSYPVHSDAITSITYTKDHLLTSSLDRTIKKTTLI